MIFDKLKINLSALNTPKNGHRTPWFIISAAATFMASLQPMFSSAVKIGANDDKLMLKILDNIEKAKRFVNDHNFEDAKRILHESLKLADDAKDIRQVPIIYDMLVAIAIVEGNIMDAEDMLVRFIEKLIQHGYVDTDNEIVRYKLKLCRLYQMVGNTEMAEVGYRSCVATQEAKCNATVLSPSSSSTPVIDETTQILYMSSLFWYARFLTEADELMKAKQIMRKAVAQQTLRPVLQPTQMMVVLYHAAEIEFLLKEYAESVRYLTQAIELGAAEAPNNIDLPLFAVKLGVTFLFMRMYDKALYWCDQGGRLARMYGNEPAIEEANLCMRKIREFDNGSR